MPIEPLAPVDEPGPLAETLGILSDRATMAALHRAESDLADGLGEDEAQVRAALAARQA